MEPQMLSFQFTAFADIDIETAKLFVKSFDDKCKKSGLPATNVKGAPLFRVDLSSGDGYITISLERIDCFYYTHDMRFIDIFLNQLSTFNSLKILKISRLAISYMQLYLDKDYKLVEKLNSYFRFADFFGKSQEFMFRINNVQSFRKANLNVITALQNEIMTNNSTFEDLNCVLVQYDINNKPLDRFNFDEISEYIKELYRIFINQQSKIMEILSNE